MIGRKIKKVSDIIGAIREQNRLSRGVGGGGLRFCGAFGFKITLDYRPNKSIKLLVSIGAI